MKVNLLKKYLSELDNDLKQIVKYNKDDGALYISNFDINCKNFIKITYLSDAKKFLISTKLETLMIDNLKLKISINNGYNPYDYSIIKFSFYHEKEQVDFYMTNNRFQELDYDTLNNINKNTKLHFINLVENHYKDDFGYEYWNPYYCNKLSQIKDVIDEYIFNSLRNKKNNFESVNKL